MTTRLQKGIYVTLATNVLGVQGNTRPQYRTIQPTPLQLTGEWEVALLDTHYAHEMRNMLSTMIGVLDLTHPLEWGDVATWHLMKEPIGHIAETDAAS